MQQFLPSSFLSFSSCKFAVHLKLHSKGGGLLLPFAGSSLIHFLPPPHALHGLSRWHHKSCHPDERSEEGSAFRVCVTARL